MLGCIFKVHQLNLLELSHRQAVGLVCVAHSMAVRVVAGCV